jgi:hypothetical protein
VPRSRLPFSTSAQLRYTFRTSGVLQVNCALADAPRERSADGIRLKLDKSPAEFSEELGGSVMFLAMPQPPAPGKGKQQEPGSDYLQ